MFTYFTAGISKNSEFLVLLSSERFFKNSYFGRKLYTNILRLRAVETGKTIIKCAYNGHTAVINNRGQMTTSQSVNYHRLSIHKGNVSTSTFFSKYGLYFNATMILVTFIGFLKTK